jgi:hypothetical protein
MSRFDSTESTAFTSNATACQIVELGLIALDPPERIGAYTARGETRQDARNRIEAEKLTQPSHVLREMAIKSPPPQQWWDEDFERL